MDNRLVMNLTINQTNLVTSFSIWYSKIRAQQVIWTASPWYLRDGLLHLRLSEGRKCRLQVVHNALEAVALHYLPLMAAQQTQGHFKDHAGPLDEYKI